MALPSQLDPNNPRRRAEQLESDRTLVSYLQVALETEPRRWETELLEETHERVFSTEASLSPTQRAKIEGILKRRGQ